jgi:hypothetical protein
MKGKIRELEGITYDIGDAEQKKAYYRHYHRIYKRNLYKTHKEVFKAYHKKYIENNREKVNEYHRLRYANKTEEQKNIIRKKQRAFAKNKYANDAEYREKHKQDALANYYKKKGVIVSSI